MVRLWFALAAASTTQLALADVDGCTAITVGKKASIGGEAMTTHNNDCVVCDPRIAYIPARDYPSGAKRPIAPFRIEYPRYVGDRSETYRQLKDQNLTKPIGFIEQVPHTYAYWEGAYPLVNEHGLGFGESTCSASFVGIGITQPGGTALFSVGELMRIAAERCQTARCAIRVMGDLAVEHGFFGEDPGRGGAGETVTLSDRNEAWVFHITSGLKNTSATWVAQKVPENHVAVVANNFIIQEVNCTDSDNFMCSENIFSNARAANLCAFDTERDFNWLKCYAPDIRTFSYATGYAPIPYYTTLRLWRIHSLVTNNSALELTNNPLDFPFSVPAARKLHVADVMNFTRDHYKDTPYDLTQGVLAGYFGDPNRIEAGWGMHDIPGQFARGFSIERTSYSVVVQSTDQPERSIAWLATDQPITSVFVPFFASSKKAAEPYQTGRQEVYSRDSAWWAFNFVSNWMHINWRDMMNRHVGPAMLQKQTEIFESVKNLQENWPKDVHELEEEQVRLQKTLVEEWWQLADDLVMAYSDSHYTYKDGRINGIGYPAWWLQMVGFNQEFFRVQFVQPSSVVPPLLQKLLPASILSGLIGHPIPVNLRSEAGLNSSPSFAQGLVLGGAFGAAAVLMAVSLTKRRSHLGQDLRSRLLQEE